LVAVSRQRHRWRRGAAGIAGGLAYGVWAAIRVWQASGRGFGYWNDTRDYVAVARRGITDLDFWAGARPPGLPLLVKAVGHDLDAVVVAHVAGSIAAWAFFAWTVGRMVRPGWRRWLGSGLVLAFALTGPVSQWDRQILTESLALSGFAVTVAASLWFAARPTWPRGAGVVVAGIGWVMVRDAHVLMLGLGGLALVAVGAVAARRRPPLRRPLLAVGVALVCVTIGALWASERAHRDYVPLTNVYAARILPFPERLEWFADHGMPQVERLRAMARVARGAPAGEVVVVPALPAERARLRSYLEWVEEHGQRALLHYALTHPDYLLAEPFVRPERGFNDLGDWENYVPNRREVAGLDPVLFPPAAIAIALFVVASVFVIASMRTSAVFWVTVAWGASAAIHLLAVWHADAMEITRHALVPDVQFRTATLIAIALAADAWKYGSVLPYGRRIRGPG
jgi:hypothetical protein